ncbi:FAD-dependent monooxygenase [Brevibacterium sp. 'Marine']|uniref:FAD-dependent monooxygenase n=1 Tax=Brevibacterium sp. 'Marine' TaxID=2725563 RepID=UPI00145F093E|nr:FAD-dependent monooxygenase [Brevibacterium sp. 'Marine']
MDASILVVGAGPVGTCLAIDAGLRGVDVTVVESRSAEDPPDAKCNTIASRTMEIFRRFGIADQVREAGLPDAYPTDTLYATSVSGPELTRIVMPSRSERSHPGFYDSEWPTPEPMVRESQMWLEPILRQCLLSLPNVRFLPETEFVSSTQDADGVTAVCRPVKTDDEFELRVGHLIGCDGGSSRVRKQMGVRFQGDGEISRTRSTLIRSAGVRELFGSRRPAWMTWIANSRVKANVVAIDGQDLWLVHRALDPGETDFETVDLEQSIRDALGVGPNFDFEIIRNEDWVGRRLVADRFRDGRLFVAGDAAHLWVPFAGYGMNAGIADATNLSWLLSAVHSGWADAGILDAYEAERQPLTDQVSRLAMAKMEENADLVAKQRVPRILTSRGLIGRIVRRRLGRKLLAANIAQMSPEGLNFGYYYEDSPIIPDHGQTPPTYDMGSHVPSTVPGCRLPHFSVDGISILDRLGPDYTLIRFNQSIDVAPLVQGPVPFVLVDAVRPTDPVFEHDLLIVRSDTHVAWRGNDLPGRIDELSQQLRGAPASSATSSAALQTIVTTPH